MGSSGKFVKLQLSGLHFPGLRGPKNIGLLQAYVRPLPQVIPISSHQHLPRIYLTFFYRGNGQMQLPRLTGVTLGECLQVHESTSAQQVLTTSHCSFVHLFVHSSVCSFVSSFIQQRVTQRFLGMQNNVGGYSNNHENDGRQAKVSPNEQGSREHSAQDVTEVAPSKEGPGGDRGRMSFCSVLRTPKKRRCRGVTVPQLQ